MRVQETSLEKQRLRTFSSCLPAREDLTDTHTHTHMHTHPQGIHSELVQEEEGGKREARLTQPTPVHQQGPRWKVQAQTECHLLPLTPPSIPWLR